MRGRRKRKLVEPGQESPLDFAVQSRDRNTLAMVREALGRGDCVLAYQPVVQAVPPQAVAFYEGLIRILDETGRVIPARNSWAPSKARILGGRSTAPRCAPACGR